MYEPGTDTVLFHFLDLSSSSNSKTLSMCPTVKSQFQWVRSNLQQENCCYTKNKVNMRT